MDVQGDVATIGITNYAQVGPDPGLRVDHRFITSHPTSSKHLSLYLDPTCLSPQNSLGDVVYVELPDVDDELAVEGECCRRASCAFCQHF